MTLLAPGFLYGGLVAVAGIVALHFIVIRQPRSSILPTARFVPDTRATTVAPARRPTDLPLMLLRALTILAASAALAKPVLTPQRRATARVILVDVSGSVTDMAAVRDSARNLYRNGDAVLLFDSAARLVGAAVVDSLARARPSALRGNLSAALVAAVRAGSSLRERADSLELVIVSPFAKEEFDAATDSIRRLWPGTARLVAIRGAHIADSETAAKPSVAIDAERDDPLAITAALARGSVRSAIAINRGSSSTLSGATVLDWPANARPPHAVARQKVDTVGGVFDADSRVVAPFERRWSYPADSIRGAEVSARWVDGEPAAIEFVTSFGCARSVAVPVALVGDLAIRAEFVRFVVALSAPCSAIAALAPADPRQISALTGSGGLAPRQAFSPGTDAHSSLAPWLLALALLSAIAELFVRARPVEEGFGAFAGAFDA